MSLRSRCSCFRRSSVILSIWLWTVSNFAVNLANGAARPSSFSHQLRSRRTSSSETEKPRIVVTMVRRLSPAGPTSLLRTSVSMAWLISCNSACAADPKETIEPVSAMSSSSIRARISWLISEFASFRGTTALASATSGRTTEFTSSTIASVFSASLRVFSDMGSPVKIRSSRFEMHTFSLQTLAQHFYFHIQILVVVRQQLVDLLVKAFFEIGQQHHEIPARVSVCGARVDVGKLDRRVACAHQIDTEKFLCTGHVARIFLDGADHLAHLGRKSFDPRFDLSVTGSLDGIHHRGKVI